MPNFSRIVRVGFEIVVFWSGVRKMLNPAPRYPKLGTGPSPASPYFNVLTGTDHLAKVWAPCGAIWHTSSKGMPRHAHRRWALIRFSDVDKY